MDSSISDLPYNEPFDVVVPVPENKVPTTASKAYLKGALITDLEVLPMEVGNGRWYKLLALQPNLDSQTITDQRTHLKVRHDKGGNLVSFFLPFRNHRTNQKTIAI